jgi:hypothetical protein
MSVGTCRDTQNESYALNIFGILGMLSLIIAVCGSTLEINKGIDGTIIAIGLDE